MPSCGSNPSLCGCPNGPIPLSSNDPSKPQHPCLICRQGIHGCGFGCGHELDSVKDQYDAGKLTQLGFSPGAVICNGCHKRLIEKMKLKLTQTQRSCETSGSGAGKKKNTPNSIFSTSKTKNTLTTTSLSTSTSTFLLCLI